MTIEVVLVEAYHIYHVCQGNENRRYAVFVEHEQK